MLFVIAGVIIFFGMHLVSACTRCRESLAARIGENGYRGVFVAGSVVGFLLIAAGTAWVDFLPVYEPPAWGRQAARMRWRRRPPDQTERPPFLLAANRPWYVHLRISAPPG
jgi:uncharacterized membrane protein